MSIQNEKRMKVYLLFDAQLRYSLNDEPKNFKPLEETRESGCENGEETIWQVSVHDELIEEIRVIPLSFKTNDPDMGSCSANWIRMPENTGPKKCV
jgi:hypothetical protein